MILVAAALTAVAVELARPSGRWVTHERLRDAAPDATLPVRLDRLARPTVAVLAVAAAVIAVGVGLSPAMLLLVVAAGVAAVTIGVVVLAGRRRVRDARQRRRVVEALALLATELRAGALPDHALSSVAHEFTELGSLADAARHGDDVAAVLDDLAARPGCEALTQLAAAWRLADRSGAPVATTVARLTERVRDELELATEVDAEVAPARATARMMATLPLLALGLGAGGGGDPVAVIRTNPVVAGCVLLGVALASGGLLWVDRAAGRAVR